MRKITVEQDVSPAPNSNQSLCGSLCRGRSILLGVSFAVPVATADLSLSLAALLGVFFLVVRTESLSAMGKGTALLLGLSLLSGLALIASAVLNGTPWPTSSIGNTFVVATYVSLFVRTSQSIEELLSMFVWVLAFTVLYRLVVHPGDLRAIGNPEGLWKWSIGTTVAFLVLALLALLRVRGPILVLSTLGLAVVSLALNYRQLALICVATIVFSLVYKRLLQGGRRSSIWAPFAAIGIACMAAFYAVNFAITRGWFGQEILARTAQQSSGSDSLILGARTETPLSLAAIILRPFGGWGNIQAINSDVFRYAEDLASRLGYGDSSQYYTYWVRPDGFISVHSIVLQTWAEGGIFAVLVWCFAIVIAVRGVLISVQLRVDPNLATLVFFTAVTLCVDLFFSPWATSRSLLLAITLALILRLAQQPLSSARADARPMKQSSL